MRPVNLIPPEDRRGDRAPLRTGALPYVVIGALAVALVLVTFMTLTSNQISDRESEVTVLEAREAEATARAEALAPYAEFAALSQARDATVTSLAQSRFDWERVLRELAFVIPDDVWLTDATGTVDPNVQIEGSTVIQGRDLIAGPALELIGCGASQDAVAGFIAALRDIDGVTRVGVASSLRPEPTEDTSASGSANAASDAGADCRTRDFIAKFEIIAAFDAVPVAPAPEAASVPGTTPPAPGSTTTEPATTETNSTAEQVGEAQDAANLVPGVAR